MEVRLAVGSQARRVGGLRVLVAGLLEAPRVEGLLRVGLELRGVLRGESGGGQNEPEEKDEKAFQDAPPDAGEGGGGFQVFGEPSGTVILSVTGLDPSRDNVML